MAATDGQITLAASRFGDTTPAYLRDFAKSPLPAVAKIIKGQYHNLGVPTLANPSLQSTALFLNAGKKYQILAQPIKLKDGRKPTNVGPKLLIPETYPGYFELLSEDGRSTRCIENVAELSRKAHLRVLVRETFRCNHLMKTIHAGEILTTMYESGKYLKCRTQKDEVISLSLEAKIKFSPIAKEESISGVHSVRNLLKKRMPVVVRLVYGTAPKGLKQPFVPELRLLGCVEIDRVFALPLQKDTDLVAVPLNAKLKLQRAKNMEQLGNFIEYLRFVEKAQRLLAEARDRLQIVDIKLSEKDKKDAKNGHGNPLHCMNLIPGLENGYVLRKSLSCDSPRYIQQQQQQHHSHGHQHGGSGSGHHHGGGGPDLSPILDEYNDIDQIYDYVRGLAPLPKNLNRFESAHSEQHHSAHQQQQHQHHHHQQQQYHSHSQHLHHHQSQHHQHQHQHHHNSQRDLTLASQTTLATTSTTATGGHTSASLHKSPSTDMAKSQPDSGNYSLIRTSNSAHQITSLGNNNNNNNNNNNSLNSSSGHHSHHHQQQHYHQHHQQQYHQHHHQHHHNDDRPVPPPIETIPGKKVPEKRQRPTLPKLYVKNSAVSGLGGAGGGGGGGGLVVNGTGVSSGGLPKLSNGNGSNAAAAAGYVINAKDGLEPQSPLFHIRYKSLSSLQLSPDSNPATPSPTSGGGGVHLNKSLHASGGGNSNSNSNTHNSNSAATTSTTANTGTGSSSASAAAHQQLMLGLDAAGDRHPLSKSASAAHCSGGGGGGTQPREGTLDSSRSGGRTSGDSNKLPEKKTRRLSRPRSLSNLVWELRPQTSKEKTKKKLYVHHYENRPQQTTLYL